MSAQHQTSRTTWNCDSITSRTGIAGGANVSGEMVDGGTGGVWNPMAAGTNAATDAGLGAAPDADADVEGGTAVGAEAAAAANVKIPRAPMPVFTIGRGMAFDTDADAEGAAAGDES